MVLTQVVPEANVTLNTNLVCAIKQLKKSKGDGKVKCMSKHCMSNAVFIYYATVLFIMALLQLKCYLVL